MEIPFCLKHNKLYCLSTRIIASDDVLPLMSSPTSHIFHLSPTHLCCQWHIFLKVCTNLKVSNATQTEDTGLPFSFTQLDLTLTQVVDVRGWQHTSSAQVWVTCSQICYIKLHKLKILYSTDCRPKDHSSSCLPAPQTKHKHAVIHLSLACPRALHTLLIRVQTEKQCSFYSAENTSQPLCRSTKLF